MARCFPYPLPVGYLGVGACDGRSLLGPIKPLAETDRTSHGIKDTANHLKRKGFKGDESGSTQSKKIKLTKKGAGSSGKGLVEDAESSGVTEEHGLPTCSSQSPSHSFDSVSGSTKRAGDECTTTTETKNGKIKIKLKVSKPKELVSIQQPCVPSSSVSQPKVVSRVADVDVSQPKCANRVADVGVSQQKCANRVADVGVPQRKVVNRVADVGVPQPKVVNRLPNVAAPQPKVVNRAANAAAPQQKVVNRAANAAPPQQKVVNRAANAAPPQQKVVNRAANAAPPQQKVVNRAANAAPQQKVVNRAANAAAPQPKVVSRAADVGVSASTLKAVKPVASVVTELKVHVADVVVAPKVHVADVVVAPKVVNRVADVGVSTSAPKVVDRVADVGVSTSAPDLKKKEEDIIPRVSSRHGSKKKKLSELYDSLTIGWSPPPLQMYQPESEDLDWLLPSKKQPTRVVEAHVSKDSCNVSACASWPRAQYIPSVDVYALPYTIPF